MSLGTGAHFSVLNRQFHFNNTREHWPLHLEVEHEYLARSAVPPVAKDHINTHSPIELIRCRPLDGESRPCGDKNVQRMRSFLTCPSSQQRALLGLPEQYKCGFG